LDLGKIIEKMSNTFLEHTDELLKSRQVDPVHIKQITEVFLELSNRASRALDEEIEEEKESGNDLREGQRLSSETILMPGLATSVGDPLSSSYFESPRQSTPLSVVPGGGDSTGLTVADPYRNYLWGTPQNCSTDGTSAIPYILAGRDSFASRLFFETIAMIVRAHREDASSDIVHSVYRYKRHYVNLDRVLGVTTGVLNMLLHGTSQDPKEERQATRAAELEQPEESTIKAAIAKDLVSYGYSQTEYLNTWNVERYLQNRWNLRIDSTTVRTPSQALEAYSKGFSSIEQDIPRNPIPFAPTMVPGFKQSEQPVLDAQSLIERIMLGVVSLGEGPRWHFSHVDSAVHAFLRDHSSQLHRSVY
jgi:hypothetical protein